ncbi:MAG: B12-binding domain-containing radical SAM protein [Acidobacteria bacterium RIFCSPLOWO2_02_FULL_65_29]|nr:MAG: B12-binding domain-containing radical SAM protein [Acidobacteria bacterium RIFCSPLOWO2_02_FULL_65_29]
MPDRAAADIVLINPRFEASYWGLEHALPLFGKRAAMPVASLPLLAALTPSEHRVTILDENVETLDFDRIARADIVGLTGMSVQRARMRAILAELKGRGVFTVVGGPWVSVHETYFCDLVRTIFVGEAEETWPQFLEDWRAGQPRRRYEQSGRTDMTLVPLPRYDLLDMRQYLFGSIQFSRGCPFQCEFCDIIVTFGRRPRLKTPSQIIRELATLRTLGTEIVFIVDDNLIGNKKAIRPLLEALGEWQESNGFPFIFVTEASLDLAEDEGLMRLMLDANILSVFIGIESPNEASIVETLKHQNVKADRSMVDRVRAVQESGLEVWSGMILGFDNDDEKIFAAQRQFLEEARIAQAMIGMLFAVPKTPLHARLSREGRLDPEDDSPFGTNVIPARLSREALRDGYVRLMEDVYQPDAYFERLAAGLGDGSRPFAPARARYWLRHPMARLKGQSINMARAVVLYARLMRRVEEATLRRRYRRELRRQFLSHRDPGYLLGYLIRCAMHYHHYKLTREMAGARAINSI